MEKCKWHSGYASLIAGLGEYGAHGRWTFCGLGVCVDAMLSAHDAADILLASPEPPARTLGQTLAQRAGAGIGGEIRVEWDGGPAWLDAALPPRQVLGGTGAHAAWVLTLLGAPALLALGHRDAEQMACLDGGICLAEHGRPTPAREVAPRGTPRPKIYIFEFMAGQRIGGAVAPRSSRIIVRFTDPGLEDDPEFEALSMALAPEAGAGVLSGFSAVGGGDLDGAVMRARSLGLRWRAAGVPVVHLEMAGFDTPGLRDHTLVALHGAFSSIGFSQSEYRALVSGAGPETASIVATAERLGVDRLCIHADAWAVAATRRDPDQERAALMMGCLLAGTRAAQGRPAWPAALDPAAVFEPPPEESQNGPWRIVSCAAPFLPQPVTTLGLGDTFMAGCLLVLGQLHRSGAASPGTA